MTNCFRESKGPPVHSPSVRTWSNCVMKLIELGLSGCRLAPILVNASEENLINVFVHRSRPSTIRPSFWHLFVPGPQLNVAASLETVYKSFIIGFHPPATWSWRTPFGNSTCAHLSYKWFQCPRFFEVLLPGSSSRLTVSVSVTGFFLFLYFFFLPFLVLPT